RLFSLQPNRRCCRRSRLGRRSGVLEVRDHRPALRRTTQECARKSVIAMNSWLWKKRIHISGSISPTTADVVKIYAHNLVRKLTQEVLERGGGIVVQVGKESFAEG